MVPNLKSASVRGTLPGTTGETIYVISHRDSSDYNRQRKHEAAVTPPDRLASANTT